MPLPPGQRVGPYEVISAIGAGGMGEVYRARDTKLNRDVALKVLPELFASDSERLARFKREAQVLASLNHPNIAQIYGFEDAAGIHALVMELVEGPTLADRIVHGPIPLSDALAIARQIAAALDAAHEQAIVHRDLKPANVKVREDGTVKVLDFGLAKALSPEAASATAGLSNSPTMTSPVGTQHGMILGTAAYMSPEQARGKPVDKRTDIWAFGCLLFEMLSGRRAFEVSTSPESDSVSDVLAAILRSEPDWSALPADTPPAVRAVLRRCLEKDRKRRIADIGDVLLLIDEWSSVHAEAPVSGSAPGRAGWTTRWLIPAAAAIAGAAVTGAVFWQWRPSPAPPVVQRLVVTLADGEEFTATGRTFVAISQDSSHLAYIANQQLYLRPLDQLTATLVPGTSGATSPFFSPDGQQLGFWQGGELKKIAVAGGAPQVICAAANPLGVSWEHDGTILFGQGADGISRVFDDGGQPSVVVSAEEKKGDIFYAPQLLPDGRTLLFTVAPPARPSGSLPGDDASVVTQDLDSGRRTVIVQGGTQGRFVSTGHVVYARQQTLWAVRFDPRTGNRSGSPVSMVEGILQVGSFGAVAVGTQNASAQFAVSRSGLLAYVESDAAILTRSLVWTDRQGRETPIPVPERSYGYPRISPDGTRVALDIRDEGQDIWVLDLERVNLRKLTFDSAPEIAPAWTPDGRRIAFYTAGRGLFWQSADGTGSPEQLIESGPSVFSPSGFTADTGRLVFHASTGPGWGIKTFDLQSRTVADLGKESSATAMNSALSPDGRWLAYEAGDRTDQSRAAVYVRPFPDVDSGLWQIACTGCTRPVWSRNARELFFLSGGQNVTSIWSVPVESSPAFTAGTPRKLFEGRYFAQLLGRTYDVSPDGQRFLMVKLTSGASSRHRIVVVDNWTEELKRRVPADR